MSLPLVQGRIGASSAPSFRFAQAGSIAPIGASPFKNSQAVVINISDDARTRAAQSLEKPGEVSSPSRVKGTLDSILESLARVTTRISSIDSKVAEGSMTEEQKIAYAEEKNALTQEYDRITKSKEFGRITETLSAIQSSLSAGASPQDLQRLLSSSSSLLGSGVLGLVSYGNSGGLSNVSSILSGLAGATSETLNSGGASYLRDQVLSAQKLLSGPTKAIEVERVSSAEVAAQQVVQPELQEMQFVSNDKYALSLKGYSGKGLLAAAASGLDLKESDISVLTLSIPKSDEEIEGEQEVEKELSEIERAASEIS